MKEVSQPPAPLPTNPIQFASPVHQAASTPPLPYQPVVERAPPLPVATRPSPPVATRPSPPVNKPSPLIQPKPNGVMTANEVSSLSLSSDFPFFLSLSSFLYSSQTVTTQATPSSPLPPDLPPPKGFDATGKCNTNYLIDIPVI